MIRSGWVGFWGAFVAGWEVVDGGGRGGWKEGGGFVRSWKLELQFLKNQMKTKYVKFRKMARCCCICLVSRRSFSAARATAEHTNRTQDTWKTHHLQSSAPQNPFRRRRNTTAIPLEIPHYLPPPHLRKHGADLLDMCGIGAPPVGGWARGGGGGRGEEEISDG